MARFLHVADIHLGFDRYGNKVRSRDFFDAFYDLLKRYAVDAGVDFVLLVGDLFEHRTIQPSTLNQAQICLQMLQQHQIPAIAIEGNHDNRPYGVNTSWLRYLADWGLLTFLEPEKSDDGQVMLTAWDATRKRGSYIDISDVRIVGSSWYGAMAPQAIETLATAIKTLPAGPGQTLVLFHHGLEGHVSRYAGALRYEEVLPLRQAGVDYLALGHIHKCYVVENWVFNPGSVEANSVEESQYERGAFLVNLTSKEVQAQLCTDYRQRSIVRLTLKLSGQEVLDEVRQAAHHCVEAGIASGQINPGDQPIVELRIVGRVGFDPLDLDTRTLQSDLQQVSQALIFLLRYEANPVSYESPLGEESDRLQIENEIYKDIVASNAVYRHHTPLLAKGLGSLKEAYLQGDTEPQLYELVEQLLLQTQELEGSTTDS